MIGRAVGSRNHKQTSGVIGNTIVLFMILALVMTGTLLILVKPIVGIMNVPEEAVKGTTGYLAICFIGIPLLQLIIL